MKEHAQPENPTGAEGRFEDYFRDGVVPIDSQGLWQIGQHETTLEALRGLFHGPAALVRLRVWVFVELMSLPQSRLAREDLNRHFHVLRPEALSLVLGRLREVGLLGWDPTTQDHGLPPLATQVMSLLAPLLRSHGDDADLAELLAGVAGAQQLGLLQPTQLLHLQAQLARLHDEFGDAIASGSEFRLRQARHRFERALSLVDKASQTLTAIITGAQGNTRLERIARDLGLAQAGLLAMASQFNRAVQQADRQRITLGSTGVTTTDVRRWLQSQADFGALLSGALSTPVGPVMVSAHELLDVAEAEFERDRPGAALPDHLPAAQDAPAGVLDGLALPPELAALVARLGSWQTPQPVGDAVLGGRYAQAAYRAQLLPLLGDPQAQALQGSTGDMARAPWRVHWQPSLQALDDPQVQAMSQGWLVPDGQDLPAEAAAAAISLPEPDSDPA